MSLEGRAAAKQIVDACGLILILGAPIFPQTIPYLSHKRYVKALNTTTHSYIQIHILSMCFSCLSLVTRIDMRFLSLTCRNSLIFFLALSVGLKLVGLFDLSYPVWLKANSPCSPLISYAIIRMWVFKSRDPEVKMARFWILSHLLTRCVIMGQLLIICGSVISTSRGR